MRLSQLCVRVQLQQPLSNRAPSLHLPKPGSVHTYTVPAKRKLCVLPPTQLNTPGHPLHRENCPFLSIRYIEQSGLCEQTLWADWFVVVCVRLEVETTFSRSRMWHLCEEDSEPWPTCCGYINNFHGAPQNKLRRIFLYGRGDYLFWPFGLWICIIIVSLHLSTRIYTWIPFTEILVVCLRAPDVWISLGCRFLLQKIGDKYLPTWSFLTWYVQPDIRFSFAICSTKSKINTLIKAGVTNPIIIIIHPQSVNWVSHNFLMPCHCLFKEDSWVCKSNLIVTSSWCKWLCGYVYLARTLSHTNSRCASLGVEWGW